jgi:DNA-binding response OmpR family regulator
MKAEVLIIEDEQELAELIGLYLENEGIHTAWAESAEIGLELLAEHTFDLIVLDINLPGMDGFEFLQEFRRNSRVPVIIVSAREADEDIIMALGVGADEFVTKPFTPRVLSARVRAVLRRTKVFANEERRLYRFADFELDYEGYNLKKDGGLIPMAAREFEILRFLVEHAGKTFSLQEVYDRVWGQEYGDLSAVSVYIQRIRKKIEVDFHNPVFIKTIHGKGYLFARELVR